MKLTKAVAGAAVHAAMCPDGEAAGFTYEKASDAHRAYCDRIGSAVVSAIREAVRVEIGKQNAALAAEGLWPLSSSDEGAVFRTALANKEDR